MNRSLCAFITVGVIFFSGCAAPKPPPRPEVPSLDYARGIRAQQMIRGGESSSTVWQSNQNLVPHIQNEKARAQLHFVKDVPRGEYPYRGNGRLTSKGVTNIPEEMPATEDYTVYESSQPLTRDYSGPLALGDAGSSPSLWQESRRVNLTRDYRAFQPMDLITILVREESEGEKEADTEVKEQSTVTASIPNLLGLEGSDFVGQSDLTLSNLLQAATTNDFKGEGDTSRKSSLTAKISAMVVEVLPSGILRVEGKKIISVNSEEQVMVISGLVRPRDVSAMNEVDSSKVANVRIDYYGQGTVGEAQNGGWLGRALRTVWPF